MGWFESLISVGVGGLLSIGGIWFIEYRKEKREKQIISNAIISEISLILKIIQFRGYVQAFHDLVLYYEKGGTEFNRAPIKVTYNYFCVFEANIGKLGLIDNDIDSIVKFYTLAKVILEDVACDETFSRRSISARIEILREDITLANELIATGNRILKKFKKTGIEIPTE